MNIGFDASSLILKSGTGVENTAFSLVSELSKIDHQNDYYLYAPKKLPRNLLLPANFHQVVLPWPKYWRTLRLPLELVRHQPDCLFVPSSTAPFFSPVKTIVLVHDLAYKFFPEAYSVSERFLQKLSLWRTASRARHIVFVSKSAQSDFIQSFNFPIEKTSVIHLGYQPDHEPAKTNSPLESSYFLFVGRLEERKNIIRLVQAFKRFCQSSKSEYKLVLIGKEGFGYSRIINEINSLGPIRDKIILTGYLNNKDRDRYYDHAQIIVYPSLYEGFGLNILEAFHHKKPLIASNISSIPEVAGNGALLVDPFDVNQIAQAMLKLSQDKQMCRNLINSGLKQLEKFSWADSAAKLSELFKTI